jgi:hypothetical protein
MIKPLLIASAVLQVRFERSKRIKTASVRSQADQSFDLSCAQRYLTKA